MSAELFLPVSLLRQLELRVFEVVVLNKKYAVVLGATTSADAELVCGLNMPFALNESIHIQRPSSTMSVSVLYIDVMGDVGSRVLPILESSLLYRLQGKYVILGAFGYFDVLGKKVCVRYVRAVSRDGAIHNAGDGSTDSGKFSENVGPDLFDHPSSESNGRLKVSGSYEFSEELFEGVVFKIGPSTKLHLQTSGHSASTGTSELSLGVGPCSSVRSTLLGLEYIRSTLLTCIRSFALSALYSHGFADENVEHGIIIYGLPGCGKRRLLQNLALCSLESPQDKIWYSRVKFITITSAMARTMYTEGNLSKKRTENPFFSCLLDHMARDPSSGDSVLPVILMLPNLDTWITNGRDDEEGNESPSDEGSHGRSSGVAMICHFIEAIEALSASTNKMGISYRFCILATATTIDGLFNLPECRRLFYRRLLVPLPDAWTRYRILLHLIGVRLGLAMNNSVNEPEAKETESQKKADHFFSSAEDIERLIRIASRLHGYTPRDLVRLVEVSYALLLSKLCSPNLPADDASANKDKPNELKLTREPELADLCDALAYESVSYLRINLSQHIAPVGPLRWNDIGGYEKLKTLFQGVVQNRLTNAAKPSSPEAQADSALGLRVPRGILLHGPPGCSKTMFVRALATECELPLIAVQASRIFGRYVGDSERNMRRILVQARASAPAILFIDEVDLLLPSRSSSETGASEHVLGEVLTAMDGVEGQNGQVILIAATNRMDKLDMALSRAGRFDLVVEVPPPDRAARSAILRLELSHRALEDEKVIQSPWLDTFAERNLRGYTGAEIVQLVQEAAQLARDDGGNRISTLHLIKAQQMCRPVSLAKYHASMSGMGKSGSTLNRLMCSQRRRFSACSSHSMLPPSPAVLACLLAVGLAFLLSVHFGQFELSIPFIS
ncbi:unnamed protein product [Calicophoron daubneyi]|uniref:AAA+ ATPase domain-containing protein n=1 Tax=Calicophoron daubneyi TaxID=300641 RepID=A0AAV2TPE9_CALDB